MDDVLKNGEPSAEDFERVLEEWDEGYFDDGNVEDWQLVYRALREAAERRKPDAGREEAIEAPEAPVWLRAEEAGAWQSGWTTGYEAHRGGGADLLAELEKRPSWELSWTEHPQDCTLGCWQIHSVTGGRNDREWTFVASGATPAEAIKAALAIEVKP